jgi:hypothetical protein
METRDRLCSATPVIFLTQTETPHDLTLGETAKVPRRNFEENSSIVRERNYSGAAQVLYRFCETIHVLSQVDGSWWLMVRKSL